jgi:hypothetical protein
MAATTREQAAGVNGRLTPAERPTIRVTIEPDGSHTGQVIVTFPPRTAGHGDRVLVLCPVGHYYMSGELGAMHGTGEWIVSRAQHPWWVTCPGALPKDLR